VGSIAASAAGATASSDEQRGDEFASAGDANFGKDVAK
jgi:hypothetical protein